MGSTKWNRPWADDSYNEHLMFSNYFEEETAVGNKNNLWWVILKMLWDYFFILKDYKFYAKNFIIKRSKEEYVTQIKFLVKKATKVQFR